MDEEKKKVDDIIKRLGKGETLTKQDWKLILKDARYGLTALQSIVARFPQFKKLKDYRQIYESMSSTHMAKKTTTKHIQKQHAHVIQSDVGNQLIIDIADFRSIVPINSKRRYFLFICLLYTSPSPRDRG